MKSEQQHFQLRDVERRGCAATEVDARWKQGTAVSSPPGRTGDRPSLLLFQLAQNGFAKSPRLGTVEQILVKCAVGTDTRAEGDVNVDVSDHIYVIPSGAR